MFTCALCRRHVNATTTHHLIPRTRHKNKKNKKIFTRQDVKTRLVSLCRPCHKNLHTIFTNKELERNYNTIEALKRHPEVIKFSSWIGSKPDGTAVPSRKPKRR